MAHGPAGVLISALQPAQNQAAQIAGHISGRKKFRRRPGDYDPETSDANAFHEQLRRQFQLPLAVRVMRQMPLPPQTLWNPQNETQIKRKTTIEPARHKKPSMKKICV